MTHSSPEDSRNRPLLFPELIDLKDSLRSSIQSAYLADESIVVNQITELAYLPEDQQRQVQLFAEKLVTRVREHKKQQSTLDAFMQEYDLSSEEGILLMCLAEALLRIPDPATAEKLIQDKLADANWEAHIGNSSSLFVNASTWGLMLTGKLVSVANSARSNFKSSFNRLVGKSGEPVIRLAVRQAMKIMGHQFVMGRTVKDALVRAHNKGNRRYRYSFDMLGEAALAESDALRYLKSYTNAIESIGRLGPFTDFYSAPSISVKLSALHPRFEFSQRSRIISELSPRLLLLAEKAKAAGIALTVDAEEADRLDITLDVFENVLNQPSLETWNGLGIVVQAYQKRALPLLRYLRQLAGNAKKRIPIRLVKGAYWDTEIKRCQEQGLRSYPVFTRKASTDVSYLACAKELLNHPRSFYPQFATHNGQTIAAVRQFTIGKEFEFQRLHGMGTALYDELLSGEHGDYACRVYAPVGSHEDLLPYLVRRLLENGANTSFVNRITDEQQPIQEIVANPVAQVAQLTRKAHPQIPLPAHIFGATRINSEGINLADAKSCHRLADACGRALGTRWSATPLLGFDAPSTEPWIDVFDPSDPRHPIGCWQPTNPEQIDQAISTAVNAYRNWDASGAAHRASILLTAADLLQQRLAEFVVLCVREAGKTIPDAIAEVREAIDFCRYYANRAKTDFAGAEILPGPTGEYNQISLHGKGCFVCISPWNFPLALFLGQVSAALAAGNSVLAKPAEQTTLIAYYCTELLYQAGIPRAVLQLLPGTGANVGSRLCSDPKIAGVAFTGSTEIAHVINRSLAQRDAAIATLIAETGGQNAMIADSSALPEQLVNDVIQSAFGSAGQRCSALRVLFVQDDIADKVIALLQGAMNQLSMGDPGMLSTDIGPVIDKDSQELLQKHATRMEQEGRVIKKLKLPANLLGFYFPPYAIEIDKLSQLGAEVFGPILHVIRFKAKEINQVITAINNTGYGLTFGIHSRIESTTRAIVKQIDAGNCYVNRTTIGAAVGVQPFGGHGLSGTGPKAGGPRYLHRFANERTLTINTSAIGGNAGLMAIDGSSD